MKRNMKVLKGGGVRLLRIFQIQIVGIKEGIEGGGGGC